MSAVDVDLEKGVRGERTEYSREALQIERLFVGFLWYFSRGATADR